jgi:hypothetical protein
MKKTFLFVFLLLSSFGISQNAVGDCKVLSKYFAYGYRGECKNGLASGKGEAKGKYWYIGDFKEGLPNGKGIIKYDANQIYTGSFQDGYKEGKGEFVYKIKVVNDTIFRDSIVKGYWCNDSFVGKTYKTYKFSGAIRLSDYDITASKQSGNSLIFEVGSATNGTALESRVQITELKVLTTGENKCNSRITSTYESGFKSYTNIEICGFPLIIDVKLSNGDSFELELYKNANWKVKLNYNE